MKYADIKGFETLDLTRKIRELKEGIFQSKMKNAMGQLTNPISIKFMRKDIARIKTALSAKRNSQRGAK